MFEIFSNIVSIFLILLIGVYGNKKGIITEETQKGLIEILLNITLPLMIVSSFSFSFHESIMNNIIKAFIYSFICFIIAIPLCHMLFKKVKSEGKIIGVYGNKKGIITEETQKGLIEILLNITLPLMIVSSFSFSFHESIMNNIIKAFIYSFICFIIAIPLCHMLFKKVKSEGKRRVLQFSSVFSNCGFIGFPIVNMVFGSEGVIYASIFNLFFTIFLWTYGVILYSDSKEKNDIKRILLNPSMISVYIGLPILIFNINIPQIILYPTNMVGSMTTPISMIVIGGVLSKVDFRKMLKDGSIYYGALVKLALLPLTVLILGSILKDNTIVVKTLVLVQAMPVATTTTIFAEKFNMEKEYSAIIVLVTTLISLLTLPFWISYLV